MDYRLENLSEDDFESLINTLCQKILGTGLVSFSKGKDGGRDGRFEGVANAYPSFTSQWDGKFIIQVKHTTDYNASCSDKPFFGNKSSLVNSEIEKIKILKMKGEIDNYLILTNRKETESREEAIKYIKKEVGLDNVDIIGKETIYNWLSQHKDIVKQYGLDKFAMPFEFYEQDIRDLIIIFYDTMPKISPPSSLILDRPSIGDKNKLNNLDESYYKNVLESDLNLYRNKIVDFLQNPINETYAQFYEDTTIELKRVIETHIAEFDNFKNIFDFLTQYLLQKEPQKLKKYRNIIPAFFHFMYYQCDIGKDK